MCRAMHFLARAFGFFHWIGISHYLNLLLVGFMVRSGLEILSAHPKLYWRDDCTPGQRMVARLAERRCRRDRLWTGADEETSFSSFIALPGRRKPRHGSPLALLLRDLLDPEWPRLCRLSCSAPASGDGSCPLVDRSSPRRPAMHGPICTCTRRRRDIRTTRSSSSTYAGVVFVLAPHPDAHRRGDVAGDRGAISLVPATLRRPPARAEHPFPRRCSRWSAFTDRPRPARRRRGLPAQHGVDHPRAVFAREACGVDRRWPASSSCSRCMCGRRCSACAPPLRAALARPGHRAGAPRAAPPRHLPTSAIRKDDVSPFFRVNGYPPASRGIPAAGRVAGFVDGGSR